MSEYKPMKLYLVKHAKYGETTVNGRTRYEAVIAAAKREMEVWLSRIVVWNDRTWN